MASLPVQWDISKYSATAGSHLALASHVLSMPVTPTDPAQSRIRTKYTYTFSRMESCATHIITEKVVRRTST